MPKSKMPSESYKVKETSASSKKRSVGMQGSGKLADKGSEVVPSRAGQRTPRKVARKRMPLSQAPIQPKVGK